MRRSIVWLLAASLAIGMAVGQGASAAELGYKALKKKAAFDDVEFELKNAIVNRGFVIDYTGHLGDMLSRTSKTVGSVTELGSASPYLKARYYHFCSAKLTHEVVSANPLNISICPYVVFLFELKSEPGVAHVGYRRPVAGPGKVTQKAVAKVDALLTAVIEEAAK